MKPGDVENIPFTEIIDQMVINVRNRLESGAVDLTYMFEQIVQSIAYLNEHMKRSDSQMYVQITAKEGKDEQRTSNDNNSTIG